MADGCHLKMVLSVYLSRESSDFNESFIFFLACFRQLCSSLRKDSVANYGSIWTRFPPYVRGLDMFYNAVNV